MHNRLSPGKRGNRPCGFQRKRDRAPFQVWLHGHFQDVARKGQSFQGIKELLPPEDLLMKRSPSLMLGLLLVLGIAFLCLTGGNRFPKSLRRAQEVVLKNDLAYMRKSIDDYTRDRQKAPQALQD